MALPLLALRTDALDKNNGTLDLFVSELPDDIKTKIFDLVADAEDPCRVIAKLCTLDSSFAYTCRTNDNFWRFGCKVLGFDHPYRTTNQHALSTGPMPWKAHFQRWCGLRIRDGELQTIVEESVPITKGAWTSMLHPRLGRLESWDVSLVRNFRAALSNLPITTPDLRVWDMRRAENLSRCFANCRRFNGDVTTWETSNVRLMAGVFEFCPVFNRDISEWDTSNVTSFSDMFSGASAFNQRIGSWETGNATQMDRMFSDCASFNRSIGSWDVSNVKYMSAMFKRCVVFNQPLDRWDVGRVHNAGNMFKDAEAFDRDISEWQFHRHYASTHELFAGKTSIREQFKPIVVVYDPDDSEDWSDMSSHQSVVDTDEESDEEDDSEDEDE